jgi:anaphase-promoting complex subunit 2
MPGGIVSARRQRIFDSVFSKANISQPTPVATPATAFTPPGQVFGVLPTAHRNHASLSSFSHASGQSPTGVRDELGHRNHPREISSFVSNHVDDQIRWDRSWHLVTHQLHLPDFPENRGVLEPLKPERESLGFEFYDALEIILYPQDFVPLARQTEGIIAWHTSQVRQHFLQQVLPLLSRLKGHPDAGTLLLRGVKILETAHRQYLHGLSFIKEQIDSSAPETSQAVTAKFTQDLHAMISNSSIEPLSDALKKILSWRVFTILGLGSPSKHNSLSQSYRMNESSEIVAESHESEKCRRELLGFVESLSNVGLNGEEFQVIFAEIMNNAMTEYVHRGCKGIWSPVDGGCSRLNDVQGHLEHSLEKVGRSSLLPRTVGTLDETIPTANGLPDDHFNIHKTLPRFSLHILYLVIANSRVS